MIMAVFRLASDVTNKLIQATTFTENIYYSFLFTIIHKLYH